MTDALEWPQWVPFATAMLGLLVGAALSELHVVLAAARERRRALNVRLGGSERIVGLERAIPLYYEKVAQHPEVAKDANRR